MAQLHTYKRKGARGWCSRWHSREEFAVGTPGAARILVCAEGEGCVVSGSDQTAMQRGDVVLLPAVVGAGRFRPDGDVTLFEIAIPEPA